LGVTRIYAEELLETALDLGADLAGAASLEGLPSGCGIYPGAAGRDGGRIGGTAAPGHGWEPRSVIACAVRLSDPIMDEVLQRGGPTPTYAYHYDRVNALLDEVALRLCRATARGHGKALPVPASQVVDRVNLAAVFSHKTAATLAGLGWIGRSALLVTPDFGPRVRLVSILTDLEARTPPHLEVPWHCGDCRACVQACPAGAVDPGLEAWRPGDPRPLDAHRCRDHMAACWGDAGGDKCGLCVAVCPWGRGK